MPCKPSSLSWEMTDDLSQHKGFLLEDLSVIFPGTVCVVPEWTADT